MNITLNERTMDLFLKETINYVLAAVDLADYDLAASFLGDDAIVKKYAEKLNLDSSILEKCFSLIKTHPRSFIESFIYSRNCL